MFYHAPVRGNAKPKGAAPRALCLAIALALAGAACSNQGAQTLSVAQTATPASMQTVISESVPTATPSPAVTPEVLLATPTPSPTPSPKLSPLPSPSVLPQPKAFKFAAATLKATPQPAPKPAPKKAAAKTKPPACTAKPKATAAPVSGLRSQESMMLSLVNEERENAGLKPLEYDAGLRAAALKHSQDMLEHGYFDHTSPVYGTFQQRLSDSGVKYSTAGENIAYYPTVRQAHAGLMNSPGHRANILKPTFTRIGIGIVYDKGKDMYYVTQWFAG